MDIIKNILLQLNSDQAPVVGKTNSMDVPSNLRGRSFADDAWHIA